MNAESQIQMQCPFCDKMLSIKREYAGQWGKCKNCGNAIEVPEDAFSPTVQDINTQGIQQSEMLMDCPDCSARISRRAANCPNCGCPVSANVQTIEKTAKRYKWGMLIGGLIMLISAIGCASGMPDGAAVGFFFGFLILALAKINAWWQHG